MANRKSKIKTMADVDTAEPMIGVWRKMNVPSREHRREIGLMLMNLAIGITMESWYNSKSKKQ
jgi:hypothetical protein